MTFKTFGKLAGNAQAASLALGDTSSVNMNTPFTVILPGTKMVTYGEASTSRMFNRAIGALSANDDALASFMDTPSLREDSLHYFHAANTGFPGSGQFGFPALWFVDPTALAVANSAQIDLGAPDITLSRPTGYIDTNIEPPPAWVYVGLYEQQLRSGSVLKLYREADESENIAGGAAGVNRSYFGRELIPDHVRAFGGGPKYHPTSLLLGSSPHSPPDLIAPISNVTSTLSPYNGASATINISEWESDGPILQGPDTFEKYHVRPGCYLLIAGSDAVNNGIWLIKSFAGDKAVLSSGSLMRVTVEAGGGASFAEGQQVTWASPPAHATAGLTLNQRTNRAYVAKKDTDTLWLIPTGIAEDTVVPGTGGSKVASTIDSGTVNGPFNTSRSGDVGTPDRETGADENWAMPVGTLLYPADYTIIASVINKAVTDVLAAGSPTLFSTTGAGGTATICAPPGFLLNPTIGLESMAADPHPVLPGKYFVRARTLTTNREKLSKSAWNTTLVESEDPNTLLPGHARDYYQNQLKTALAELHHGQARSTTGSPTKLSPWDSPIRNFLGSSLWLIKADFAGAGIGNKFEDGTLVADGYLVFTNTAAGAGAVRTRIVTGWDNYLVVKHPIKESWSDATVAADPAVRALAIGNTTTVGGNLYTLTGVDEAEVQTVAGFVDAEALGLNSAYNMLYSSEVFERAKGFGNLISMKDDRPVSLVFQGVGAQKAFKVISDSSDIELLTISAPLVDLARIKWNGSSFTFMDQITNPVEIALAATGVNGDNAMIIPARVQHQSLLGGIKAGILGSIIGGANSPLSSGVVSGGSVTAPGGLAITVAAGSYLGTGAMWDIDTASSAIADVAQDNYVYMDLTASPAVISVTNLAGARVVARAGTGAILAMVSGNGAGGVAVVRDIRFLLNRADAKTDIYVGARPTGAYSSGMTHYATLGEAMVAIEHLSTLLVEAPPVRIMVVGSTTETAVVTIPVAGLTIEMVSSGGDTAAVPTISWSGNHALFNLGGRKNLTFKNLRMSWTGAGHANANPIIIAFGSTSSNANYDNLIIDGCDLYGGEAFLFVSDQWDNIVVRNCKAVGITNTAVTLLGTSLQNGDVRISGCSFSQFSDGTFVKAPNYLACISTNRHTRMDISDNVITGIWIHCIQVTANGGDTNQVGNTVIRGNHISLAFNRAIYLDSNVSDMARIENNTVVNLSNGSHFGIFINSGYPRITGNKLTGLSGRAIYSDGAHAIISDNTVVNAQGRAIESTGLGAKISGNSIDRVCLSNLLADDGCIDVWGEDATVCNNTIIPNTVAHANTIVAIRADVLAERVLIQGNKIIDQGNNPAAYTPTGISTAAVNSTVCGNSLNGGQITVTNTAVGSVVDGNSIRHPDPAQVSYGVDVAAQGCTVVNNTIGGGGVVASSTSGGCVVSNNNLMFGNFTSPSVYYYGGTIILSGGKCVVSGNSLGGGDIVFNGAVGHCIITDNKCAGDSAPYAVGITTVSSHATAPTITTRGDHGLFDGNSVVISEVTTAAPSPVNGTHIVTVTSPTTFTIAADTSGSGDIKGRSTLASGTNGKGVINMSATGLGKNVVTGNYVRTITDVRATDRPRHQVVMLTGTVSVIVQMNAVTGVGTNFTRELEIGDWVEISGEVHRVLNIIDPTNLTLWTNHVVGASGLTYERARLEYDMNVVT